MDIRQLESFVCVAETGSMTAAAQKLFLTPPALAQQINRLEKEVRTPLFHRSPRGMTLTPAGQCFYEDAKQVLDMTASMLRRCREAGQESENIVTIGSLKGMVPDFYPDVQRAVRSRCPGIQLEHVEDTFDALRKALLTGQIDAMEHYDSPLARHPQLQYIPLISEGRSCLMAADHPLAGKERLSPQDLVGHKVYALDFNRVPGLQEHLKARCPECTLLSIRDLPKPKTSSSSGYYATLSLCEKGGICLITPHCAHHFAPLICVPLDVELMWSGGLICRNPMRPQVQAVIEAAKAAYL